MDFGSKRLGVKEEAKRWLLHVCIDTFEVAHYKGNGFGLARGGPKFCG